MVFFISGLKLMVHLFCINYLNLYQKPVFPSLRGIACCELLGMDIVRENYRTTSKIIKCLYSDGLVVKD